MALIVENTEKKCIKLYLFSESMTKLKMYIWSSNPIFTDPSCRKRSLPCTELLCRGVYCRMSICHVFIHFLYISIYQLYKIMGFIITIKIFIIYVNVCFHVCVHILVGIHRG